MPDDLEELKRAIRADVLARLPSDWDHDPPEDADEIRARIVRKLLGAPDLASNCPRSLCRRRKSCGSPGAACLAAAASRDGGAAAAAADPAPVPAVSATPHCPLPRRGLYQWRSRFAAALLAAPDGESPGQRRIRKGLRRMVRQP